MKKSKKQNIFRVTLIALFIAVMAIMDFTPLGYITTGAFSITLMTIPVALGAACGGMWGGAVLGAVFGATSFLQAFGIGFLIDPMAASLFSEKPIYYTIMCFAPRILAGFVSGFIVYLFEKRGRMGIFSFSFAAIFVPIINTVGFLSLYYAFYGGTVFGTETVKAIITTVLSINFVVEFAVTLVVSGVINRTIYNFVKKLAYR